MDIKAIVVDDEPLARRRILNLLKYHDHVEVISECSSGRKAIKAIENLKPDLIFLDIQMPGIDGIEVVKKIGLDDMPTIIFVTAYDQYALAAFRLHATDYLLKPVDKDHFEDALKRARKEIGRRKIEGGVQDIDELLKSMSEERKSGEKLLVKSGDMTKLIRCRDIDWVESQGNYVNLYVGKTVEFIRESMINLEKRLEPFGFVRIHRSTIVNLKRITSLKQTSGGDFKLILDNGKTLKLSRRYRHNIETILGKIS